MVAVDRKDANVIESLELTVPRDHSFNTYGAKYLIGVCGYYKRLFCLCFDRLFEVN